MTDVSTASVDIAGIPVDNVTFDETVALIAAWVRAGEPGTVYTPNVDDVVKAHRLADFRDAVRSMRLRVPDGMGIVYGSRLAGRPLRGTVTGRKLPQALATELGTSAGVAIIGGKPGTAEVAGQVLTAMGARVVVATAPPMGFVVGSDEDRRLVASLKASGARIVYVCLGAPKQALWMRAHAQELAAVLVGVGAAVDVLAGRAPVAPAWMTRLGLEWAFRLAHEPRRLARRYLWDDPRFFWWMFRSRSRSRGR